VSASRDRLRELTAAFLEGLLSPEEDRELEQLLRSNPDDSQFFFEHLHRDIPNRRRSRNEKTLLHIVDYFGGDAQQGCF
jgi:hypothetical protein